MLLVDLTELQRGPIALELQSDQNDSLLADVGFAVRGPVSVAGRLSGSGRDEYYLAGSLSARVIVSCRRCLAEVVIDLDTELSALFTREDSDDPTAFPLVTVEGALDLGPMVREQLLLTVPEYALCGEACRGLCANCGKDLNDGPCDCKPPVDPRWAVLEDLKADTAASKES